MAVVTSLKRAPMRNWKAIACGLLMAATGLLAGRSAQAQLRVDIYGVGATQYPVDIADYAGDAHGQAIGEVIRADLTRSGQIQLIDAERDHLDLNTCNAFDDCRDRGDD